MPVYVVEQTPSTGDGSCCCGGCPVLPIPSPAYMTFDTPGSPCLDGQTVEVPDASGGPCSCDGPFVAFVDPDPMRPEGACYTARWCSGGCTPQDTYGYIVSTSPFIVEFDVPDCGSFSSGGTATLTE